MYPVEIYLGQALIFFWPVMAYTCMQLQPAHRSVELWLQTITADSARLYADIIYRVVFMNLCYCFLHTHSDSEIIQSAYKGGETEIAPFLERYSQLGNLPKGAERGGLCRSVRNLNYRFGSALNSDYKVKKWLSLKVVRLSLHLLIFIGDIFTRTLENVRTVWWDTIHSAATRAGRRECLLWIHLTVTCSFRSSL